jgi:hypothetical protein
MGAGISATSGITTKASRFVTAPGMFVLKSGRVQVTRRDPLGHLAPIVEETAGDFVAEVEQLSGRPALVDVHAVEDVGAALIPAENLRGVMIAEPELGDRIMRAGAGMGSGQPALGRAPRAGDRCRVAANRCELTLSKPLTLVCCGRPDDAH